jgi:hypothetical protein
MNVFPLIYGFRELVAGAGFYAGVKVDGSALLKKEQDGWWMYGVQPGGIAERGETEYEAYLRFKQSFREVLADSATLCSSFDAFRAEVELLGRQVNDGWAAEWNQAREALRRGDLQPVGAMADLPRKTGEVDAGIAVVELRRGSAQDNATETKLEAAA